MAVERETDKSLRVRITVRPPLLNRIRGLAELTGDAPDRALLVLAHIGAGILAEEYSANRRKAADHYARVLLDVGATPMTDRRFGSLTRYGRRKG